MIELSMNTAFMLYLGLTLGTLLSIWVFQNYRSQEKKISFSEQELFICEYCQFAYMEDCTKATTQCPQCQLFNKHPTKYHFK